jgi:hypothetical protein
MACPALPAVHIAARLAEQALFYNVLYVHTARPRPDSNRVISAAGCMTAAAEAAVLLQRHGALAEVAAFDAASDAVLPGFKGAGAAPACVQ